MGRAAERFAVNRESPGGSIERPAPIDGQNPVVQAARLVESIPLASGMRVLDLGCGRAASSIWLARERGVSVWAVDRDVPPTDNFAAVREAGCEALVHPLRADARDLPFPERYFDAVVAIDSWLYFGTDDRFLPYLARFVRRDGHVAIADIGFTREIASAEEAPRFLRETWSAHWSYVHSIAWWKSAWERTGIVDVVAADPLPESRPLLQEYVLARAAADRSDEIARATLADDEGLLLLFRLVARIR